MNGEERLRTQKSIAPDTRRERNYGIDLLRLAAMFTIVTTHVMGDGGVLANTSGWGNDLAWLVEMVFFCFFNAFGVISGYAGYRDTEKPRPYKKALALWVQVFFYSFGIALLFFVRGTIGAGALIKSALPIAVKQYWYVSAYFGVLAVAPWLDRLIRRGSERENAALMLVIFAVFSVYATFARRFGDPFSLENGYSFLWLSMLYLVGAAMKKYRVAERLRAKPLLLCALACLAISWLWKIAVPAVLYPYCFASYVSPTALIAAAALVCLFSKLPMRGASARLTAFFAPAAFGVYLIHVHPLVLSRCIAGAFAWIGAGSAWLVPVWVLLCSAAILLACLFVEKARLALFSLLKIDDAVRKLSDALYRLFRKIPALNRAFTANAEEIK